MELTKIIIEQYKPDPNKYYIKYKQEWRTFNKKTDDGVSWFYWFPEDMRTWATDNNIKMIVKQINHQHQVEFDNKQDLMFFKLRWGG